MKFVSSAHLVGGGTISGDVTIDGDLTVNGGGGFSYSEVLTGDFQIVGANGTVVGTADTDGDEFIIRNNNDAGMSILAGESDGHTSSIVFGSASDLNGANISYEYHDKLMMVGTQHSSGILKLRSGNGADALTIDASQNIGMGGSPVSLSSNFTNLTLNGAKGGAIIFEDDGTSQHAIHTTDDNSLRFLYGSDLSSEAMRIDSSGNATFAGSIKGNSTNFDIYQTSSDASDNRRIRIGGGGDVITSRGAYIEIAGNEHTNTGQIILNAGDVTGGDIIFKTDNTTRLTIDDTTGNVGIGLSSLEAWQADYTSLQLGGNASIIAKTADGASNPLNLLQNVYLDTSSNWKKIREDQSSRYLQLDGVHSFFTDSGTGSADSLITWTTNFVIDSNSRISLSNNDSGGDGGSDGTSGNTLFGAYAGLAIANGGVDNNFFGHAAGNKLETGDYNVGVGNFAGFYNVTGSQNTYVGYGAGWGGAADQSHSSNVGVGYRSLKSIRTGGENVSIGTTSMEDNNSGSGNVSIGMEAMMNLTTGSNNVAIGKASMNGAGVNPSSSTAIGYASARYAEGSNNIALGYSALKGDNGGNFVGANNIAIGYEAMDALEVGEEYNIAIGSGAIGAMQEGSNGGDVDHNIAIGADAFKGGDLATADVQVKNNIAIGSYALDATGANAQTGTIAIGHQNLTSLTSGLRNTAIGYQSAYYNTTGSDNTYLGYWAGSGTSGSHSNNVGIGSSALGVVSTGSDNIAIGKDTMGVHTTGGKNVAIGHQVMYDTNAGSNSLGSSENVFIGYQVASGGWTDAACNHNVGIGNDVMRGALDGANYNVALGSEALMGVTTGDANIVAGYQAGNDITTGEANICIGNRAGDEFDAENYNIFIGEDAGGGAINGADKCIAIGKSALDGAITQDGTIAIGHDSLTALTTGAGNTAIGYEVGKDITTGENNTLLGYQAGQNILGGNNNIAIGTASGETMTGVSSTVLVGKQTGQSINNADALGTVAIGHQALKENTSGQKNTAIGYLTLSVNNDIGDANTAVGYEALKNFNPSSDGHGLNTAVGASAGEDVSTGTGNTLIGDKAGNTGTNDLTTGTLNTLLGQLTAVSASDATNQTVIGRGATGQADNSVTLGNSSVTHLYLPNNAKIAGYGATTVADDGTITVCSSTAGSVLVSVYNVSDGYGMLAWFDYASTGTKLAGGSNTDIADTDTKICLISASNNNTITFKNRLGSSKNFHIVSYSAFAT